LIFLDFCTKRYDDSDPHVRKWVSSSETQKTGREQKRTNTETKIVTMANETASSKGGAAYTSPLLNLPDTHIHKILEYLSLREHSFLLGSNCYLWGIRHTLRSLTHKLLIQKQDAQSVQVESSLGPCRRAQDDQRVQVAEILVRPCLCRRASQLLFWNPFRNLQQLDLASFGTDNFLRLLGEQDLLQNLQHISMVRSIKVTDQGLIYLSMGESRAKNLRSIDITYCRSTTYKGTFPLRERLVNLQVIRRQPEWLDGQFHTPFGGATDQDDVEIHTYWPDGTFSFNRDTQSSGFVCELVEWDIPGTNTTTTKGSPKVSDKLQYNNFSPIPIGWPDWTRFCYRPGVSLLRLDDEMNKKNPLGEKIRSVLVAQYTMGLKPPRGSSIMELAKMVVPLGETKYFDIHEAAAGRAVVVDGPERGENNVIMVSRMRLYPLPKNGKGNERRLLPPDDLVQRNKETCENMSNVSENSVQELEEMLHRILTRP
jgi:hypothetical protein